MSGNERGVFAIEPLGPTQDMSPHPFELDLDESSWCSPSRDLTERSYLPARKSLRHENTYFPLGFPVRIRSDSERVLDAADQSWNMFKAVFHRRPLEISITVKPEARIGVLPPAPTHTRKGCLLVQTADSENSVITDLNNSRAVGRVTETTVRYQRYFRYHFLEGAALCMLATRRCIGIHGACVRVRGIGILLCGDSGDGKSTLSFAGARGGWTYISDDATYLPIDRNDRLVLGNCHRVRFRPSATKLFPELAGRPITPRASGKPSIEVSTSEWPGINTANAAFIDHIVFLNRKSVAEEELLSVRPAAVWPWFRENLLSTPESRPAQEAALSRLLSANIFELRYRDLSWAIERIDQLATKGR